MSKNTKHSNSSIIYPITYGLIIINIIIYLISAYYSKNISDIDNNVLLNMGALYGPNMQVNGQWWRLFTSLFLHASIMHILMNMYSLYIVGRAVEQYFSPMSYLSIYLFSGLIGGVVSLFVHPDSLGVGASGAIFGLLGALSGFFLAHRNEIASQSKAFFANFGSVIVLNLVLGFSIPNIDMSAHIGGLVAGFIGGFMIAKKPTNIWVYSFLMIFIIIGSIKYLSA